MHPVLIHARGDVLFFLVVAALWADVAIPEGSSFWACMATVAFIIQMVLQRYWARQAAGQADAAAKMAERHAITAAEEVARVRDVLKATTASQGRKLDDSQATGNMVHVLTNKNMGLALQEQVDLARANLVLAKELAALRGTPESARRVSTAEDKVRATERAAADHEGKQADVDASQGKPKSD